MPHTGAAPAVAIGTGAEWIVDAYGCRPDALRSVPILGALFDRIVADLELRPLRPTTWHAFPGEGGVTGLLLLSESHLACHTFPEQGFAAFNLYCCRIRTGWPWSEQLAAVLGARDVTVRQLARGTTGHR